MKSYKNPSFSDRSNQAAEAKQRALDSLRNKPPIDEAKLAARQAARERREAAQAEKRAAKAAAAQAEADRKAAEAAAAEAAAAASRVSLPTEAELKAARDARYAARKKRS